MLKRIKLKNSQILFIGLLFIILGIFLAMFEYFMDKKDKVYSNMYIDLYTNDIPNNIFIEGEEPDSFDTDALDDMNNNIDENIKEENNDKENNILNEYIGVIEIPKINLKRGFLDLNSKYNSISYNVTVIKGSTFPDEENNNLILAAHSGNCTICYFDKLYKLEKLDKAYIYYKNIKYTYQITNIYEVEKIGTVPIYRDYNKNVLTLITCTRNSNTKQTVYILELLEKNSY